MNPAANPALQYDLPDGSSPFMIICIKIDVLRHFECVESGIRAPKSEHRIHTCGARQGTFAKAYRRRRANGPMSKQARKQWDRWDDDIIDG
jgi:hypothetical protein